VKVAKARTSWSCNECGHRQARWSGQCGACEQWNCLVEEVELPQNRWGEERPPTGRAVQLKEVVTDETTRTLVGLPELDRLLGGGLVRGSLVLVGGEPGIGKSTLLLQVAHRLGMAGQKVLYVSGEESLAQTSLRARRLGVESEGLYLFGETELSAIRHQVNQLEPQLLVIDSIQIVYRNQLPSAPGSVTQVRECALELMRWAKGLEMTVILVGHVTKSGEIAGPRVLEHMVDTVLYFEGEKLQQYRILRAVKNRFGATDEMALFQMTGEGLREVDHPSRLLLEERRGELPGSAVIPTLEGSRPILIEAQALVTPTSYATPSRRAAGMEAQRLALLLAVLEKRVGYQLHNCDVFVSIAGGMHIEEPAVDLGIVLAIASSFSNRSIPADTVVLGEVGLGGEVRSVPRIESRLKEALQMGFRSCLIPKRGRGAISKEIQDQLEIREIELVEEAIDGLVK
jgi:DNA repair protein RadA/Sms